MREEEKLLFRRIREAVPSNNPNPTNHQEQQKQTKAKQQTTANNNNNCLDYYENVGSIYNTDSNK